MQHVPTRPWGRKLLLCALTLAVWAPVVSFGAARQNPAVGLVLGGGGARGLAHVGVLQWLEDHRIPVDYVAGTSMGGFVGALFARGIPPDQIESIVLGMDWGQLLAPDPGYQNSSVRRQEDWRLFPAGVDLGLRGGLRLPSGLSSGHSMGLMLDALILPVFEDLSFDDLPWPFACLATDLVEARQVVLRSGSLGQALRATMAVPALLSPVELDGKLLVDGGVLNNLPTDVVREMGADWVIAVNVGTPLADRSQLDSLTDVLGQMVAITGLESDRRNLRLADVVVTPDLDGFTSLDFRDVAGIVQAGYAAAEALSDRLLPRALDEAGWSLYQQSHQPSSRQPPFEVAAIEVLGADEGDSSVLEDRLGRHIGGEVDVRQLERDLNHVVGEGRFDALGYSARSNGTLEIHAVPSRHGPPFLTLGFNLVATSGKAVTGVGGRYTDFDLGGYGAELRIDGVFGTHAEAAVEYYRPFGQSRVFIAPRVSISGRDQPLGEGSEGLELRTRQFLAALELGVNLGRHSRIGFSYETGHRKTSLRDGSGTLSSLGGEIRVAGLRWVHDTRSDPTLPMSGVRAQADARWHRQDPELPEPFARMEASLSGFLPLGNRDTVFAMASGGTGLAARLPDAYKFALGGPFRLGGYQPLELTGSRYLLTAGGYIHDLLALAPFPGSSLNMAFWHEYGWLGEPGGASGGRHSGSAGLIAKLPFGSLWVVGSVAEGGRRKAYVVIGRAF